MAEFPLFSDSYKSRQMQIEKGWYVTNATIITINKVTLESQSLEWQRGDFGISDTAD